MRMRGRWVEQKNRVKIRCYLRYQVGACGNQPWLFVLQHKACAAAEAFKGRRADARHAADAGRLMHTAGAVGLSLVTGSRFCFLKQAEAITATLNLTQGVHAHQQPRLEPLDGRGFLTVSPKVHFGHQNESLA